MVESFTLQKDSNNIPVCAYQVGANALNYVAWVAVQVVDDTQTTDAGGVYTSTSKPVLDTDGDGEITAADVNPRRTDTGAVLYVGTAAGDVDSNAGEFTLYTDEARSVPAANLEVKCTYWTLVPLAVDSSGRLVLAPASSVEISASALPTGAATEATLNAVWVALASLATEATLTALAGTDFATQTTLAAILAKLAAAPATEAKQDVLNAKDFSTETTLAAILAKLIAAPATEAKQDDLIAKDFATETTLQLIKAALTVTNRKTVKTVTIANGQSLSDELDLEDYTYMALHLPAAWTAADITFASAAASGGTFDPIYSDAGVETRVVAEANRVVGVNLAGLDLAALRYLKLRSGTVGTPVPQDADRQIVVELKK